MGEKLSFSLRLLCISMFTLSCAIDIDVTDLTRASSTLNFENPEDFIYDANYVEITDNRISLKPLDLTDSGDDFSRGNHVGTSYRLSTRALSLDNLLLDTIEILPERKQDLLAHWSFDNKATDSSPNSFDLVLSTGAGYSSDDSVVGTHSAVVTSSNAFVHPDGAKMNQRDVKTISMWIQKDGDDLDGGSHSIPLRIGTHWYSDVLQFRVNNGDPANLSFQISKPSTSSNMGVSGVNSIANGRWFHIVGVVKESSLELYVNGSLISENTSLTELPLNSGNPIQVGYAGTGNGTFSGKIDEVAIFTKALSPEEIYKLYYHQSANFTELSSTWTPQWKKIVGYWKMDGNWQDSSGHGLHGTPTGNPNFIPGKVGPSAGEFDGINQHIAIGSIDVSTWNAISVAGWFRTDSTFSSRRIFSLQHVGANDLRVFYDGFGRITFSTDDGTEDNVSSANIYNDNQWHHFIAVFTGLKSLLYMDGVLVSSASADFDFTTATAEIRLANSAFGGNQFAGDIDDVTIWSVALSDAETSHIFKRQKQKYAGSYDSEVIDLGSTTSNWPDLSWSTRLPFGKELVGDLENDGSPDSERSSDYPGLVGESADGLIAYYPFLKSSYDGSTSEVIDIVGGHHGTKSSGGGLEKTEIGSIGNGFVRGANLSVSPANAPTISDTFSVSLWLKATGLPTAFPGIITKGSAGTFERFFKLQWNAGARDLSMRLDVNGTNAQELRSSLDVIDGNFHHIVVQSTGNTLELYIDGKLDGQRSININSSGIDDPTGSFFMGTSHLDAPTTIDELALWNRPLSLEEVQQLYHRGANRVKLQVRSCVDSSCNCKSFSAAPPGSVNDCDGDGTVNAEDSDDIHQAEFMGPGGDGKTYFSELMNRKVEDIVFDCDANTSDSDDSICDQDEILLTGSPKPTSPMFSFDDYLGSVKPQPNRYFQYRVNMEADENTACDGEPCLPELTSVSLAKDGESRYYGTTQVVESRYPIAYNDIQAVSLEASTCVKFQLSPDKETYYFWNGKEWTPAASDENRSTASELESNITKYSDQFRKTNLYFKAFLSSDTTTPCDLGKIDLDYRELF